MFLTTWFNKHIFSHSGLQNYNAGKLTSSRNLTVFTHLALEALGCFLKVVQLLLEIWVCFGHEQQDVGLDVSSEDFGGRLSETGKGGEERRGQPLTGA